MASKFVEGHLDRESSGEYKVIKAGRFWLLRNKGKTKRISFLDNASEVSITENILVAGDNIFEIDEDENGQISFQRVENVSYNSKHAEPDLKDKVQNKQDLTNEYEYQETNASSCDDSRNLMEFAMPIHDETKEYVRISRLTVDNMSESKTERRPVGSGLINRKAENRFGKDDIEETEDFSDRVGDLERGHGEYVALERGSTEEDSTIEIKRKQFSPRKCEDAEVYSGLRHDPLTGRNLSTKDTKHSAQNQLYQTFEPLSYQDENGAYIYFLCGSDEQSIVLSSDDMFETRTDAIVISVESKRRAGSTAAFVLWAKMPRLVFLEYMREVDIHLKKMKLGDVFLTDGYSSGYRYIIHVIFQISARNKPCLERQLDLRKMYENIFKVCLGHKEIQSVAITLFGIDTGLEEEVKMGSKEMLNAYINGFGKKGPRLGPMSIHLKCRREITFSTVKDVFDFYVTGKKAVCENALQRCTYAGDTATEVQCDRRYDAHCHICMETVTNKQTLECGHAFCYKCLKQHYTAKRTCPICRRIPGEAAVNSGKVMPKTEEEILCSEMVWKVISTCHSEELGKLKANFDELRYNSGILFVTAAGRSDVSESLLKEFRKFIEKFNKKEYCEVSVGAAKDVRTLCNDIERAMGYECCMYEPGMQTVVVYSNTYEECCKIKHWIGIKSGVIKSTGRRRRSGPIW